MAEAKAAVAERAAELERVIGQSTDLTVANEALAQEARSLAEERDRLR